MDISRRGGSVSYKFNDLATDVIDRIYADTDSGWNAGLLTGHAAVRDNALVNLVNPTTNLPGEGTWTGSIVVDTRVGYLEESRLTWEAEGAVTVETSVNGTTWAAATNGSNPIPRTNLQFVEMNIFVRVTFGTTEAKVNKLNLTLYLTKYVYGTNVDIVGTVTGRMLVSENDALLGTLLNNLTIDNSLSIPVDTAAGSTTGFESVVKFASMPANTTIFSTTGASIATNASGAWVATGLTLYVDGVVRTVPYVVTPNEWHHVVATFANTATPLVFSSPQTFAYLGTFHTAPTATEANSYFGEWFTIAPQRFLESSLLTITEPSPSVRGYAYAWSVSSG